MFAELTGNELVKAALKRMLVSDRLPGALLFTGEEGIGKKLFALEVARTLNCRTPKDHEACGVCSSCTRIAKLNYPQREDAEARIENLQELVSAAREYELREDDATLGGFVDRLSLLSEADEGKGAAEYSEHVTGWDHFLPQLLDYAPKVGAGA